MSESQFDYSVVVPVFNSQQALKALVGRLDIEMRRHGSFEIVCVDDGSADDSWKVLKELHGQFEQLKIYRLSKNYGQAAATLCGIDISTGKHIITIDDDLQYAPESISLLLDEYHLHKKMMVFGVAKKRKHSAGYRLALWFLQQFFRLWPVNYINGSNISSSFRVFGRDIMKIPNAFGGRLQTIHVANYNLLEQDIGIVNVEHTAGQRKNTSYTFIKRLENFVNLMLDLHPRPMLRVVPHVVVLIMLWFGVFAAWTITDAAWLVPILVLVSGLMLSVLLMAGIMATLYLGKVLSILNGSPPYLILEKYD